MLKLIAISLPCVLLASGCARIDEAFNRVQRSWDASPKTVTVYSIGGTAVKTYDIGRSKVTRADGTGDYIYFYSDGRYIQTNMPYIVEAK